MVHRPYIKEGFWLHDLHIRPYLDRAYKKNGASFETPFGHSKRYFIVPAIPGSGLCRQRSFAQDFQAFL
jgi:hypothetical protein